MGTDRVPATGSVGTRRRSWIGRCPRPVVGPASQRLFGEAWRAVAPTLSDRLCGVVVACAEAAGIGPPLCCPDLGERWVSDSATGLNRRSRLYLLSDRVVSIALFGYSDRIGVEVFTQRPLAKSFNRA